MAKETSVAIIPITDENHLKWIVETQTVDYVKRASRELSLFDNEDYVFAETPVAHVIMLYPFNGKPLYLTSVQVREGSEPFTASSSDLELLSYPDIERLRPSTSKFFLIDVDTGNVLKPSLRVDADKLVRFLNERYVADVCSVYPQKELETEGVIKSVSETADIPDESYDLLNELRHDLNGTQGESSAEQGKSPTRYPQIRAAKELLRITFPDGTVLCDRNAVNTFAKAIEKIGVDTVAALGLEFCKTPLLSREYSTNKNYKIVQREIGDGWILFTQGSTTTKLLIMKDISNRLGLELKIEKGAELTPVTKEKTSMKKSVKNTLLVTLVDGTFIAGDNSKDVYVKTLRHIGLDKVRRINADIMGVPLVTTQPAAKVVQSDEHNGLYITIPNGTKKMYKYLMLIASFTHTRLTVTII